MEIPIVSETKSTAQEVTPISCETAVPLTSSNVSEVLEPSDSPESAVSIKVEVDNASAQESKPVGALGVTSTGEKHVDSLDTPEVKPNKPKSKRKKRLDPSAPRQPLSGYMRYLNERRDSVRGENPTLSFADLTKLLAEEWNRLPQEKKQPYVEAGQQDRERYARELTAYKQTEAYRISAEKLSEKKARKARESIGENGALSDTPEMTPEVKKESDGLGSDVNIFTDEFLELNRTCESEFRQLRNQNTEFEERNALLDKHNESMRAAIEKLEKANELLRCNNAALEEHLDEMRMTLAEEFQQLPLPGTNFLPTVDTLDEYMAQLQQLIASKRELENGQLLTQVREVIQKYDFDG